MQYKAFRIQNFKGIRDTTIHISGIAGASVFSFVGLNESGKTTILQAIHSFSPDNATSQLLSGEKDVGVPFKDRVPRHKHSSFSGRISVSATVLLNQVDKETVSKRLKRDHSINLESIPNEVTIERYQIFKSGDFVSSHFSLSFEGLKIKTGKQRRFREPTGEERGNIRQEIYNLTPDIAYFPTFVFEFPSRIYLTDRGGKINEFYKNVFQDVLDYDGEGLTIEDDIIRRVRSEDKIIEWPSFISAWFGHDDKSKIEHVMSRAGASLTKLVFGKWNQIFGENTQGKEIIVRHEMAQGQKKLEDGKVEYTNEHDIYINFEIKDGTRFFKINDRSLGFRWFFAFMLFTQFRVASDSYRPVLFLFDEPASNLHAAAQQKLIDSFSEIAVGEHALAYTTHSHYMIEPKWLEQTFIVSNRADAPLDSVIDNEFLDDESLDIQASSYRSFVHEHPSQISYFQPILDRLRVVPSRFDLFKRSIVVEGKSDYYLIRYIFKMLNDETDIAFIPALGSTTLDSLVSLHVGWGLSFIFMLDGDKQGVNDRKKYIKEYGISDASIFTLTDVFSSAEMIEDIVDAEARTLISTAINSESDLSKSDIRRFFQERLASDNVTSLGDVFSTTANTLRAGLLERMDTHYPKS